MRPGPLALMTFILISCFINSFAQPEAIKRMTISYCGDSLITQKYELHTKDRKIYFITPLASYLHVKGQKYRRRVKIDRSKRKEIFISLYQLDLSALGRAGDSHKER